MTNNILSCPFCGAMPILITGDKHFNGWKCPECGAKLPVSTDSDAIDVWNKRALSVREHEMIKALKNARQELLHSASGYTKNAIYVACAIQDLLWRIGGDKRD